MNSHLGKTIDFPVFNARFFPNLFLNGFPWQADLGQNEGVSQSSGRHRAARHKAKKKTRLSVSQTRALLGLTGIGGLAMTSASGVSDVVLNPANILALESPAAKPELDVATTQQISIAADRAVRASRSDERSLADVAAIEEASTAGDPLVNPESVIDENGIIDDATRVGLSSVATSSEELGELQEQAQSQAKEAADNLKETKRRADEIAAQAAADAAAAAELAAREAQRGVRVTPIQVNYNLSARFGQRGGLWSRGWHTGLDFRVKNGTPVVAAAGGEIIKAERDGAYGNRIEIDHGDGTVTAYNHLSEIIVSSGWVDAGELIGKSGSTGNVTGPHLHFEVYENGDFINPAVWLWK